MQNTHIAIIGHAHNDGFEWGTSRPHYLIPLGDELVKRIVGEVGCSLDTAERIALGKSFGDYGVALVDVGEGITDVWPSAGDGAAWYDDVWLGIADYLSYAQWCDLLGVPADGYTFPDWTQIGREALESVREYLPDVPGLREN